MDDGDRFNVPSPLHQHNYWCHECDLSVSIPSSHVPLCPYCHSDFLEHMEEFDSSHQQQQSPIQNPNPNFPSLISALSANDRDINLIDSPDLRRLIRHLTDSDVGNPSFISPGSAPASKAFVEALPNVKVFEILCGEVEESQMILCAICTDQFLVDVEAKQLPCTHMYHSDCIMPWLSHHNSCPVCRYKLPVEDDLGSRSERQQLDDYVGVTFWELMESEDTYGFRSTLRHIARRHRNMYPDDSFISTTPVADAQVGDPLVVPANTVDTVSSNWHFERDINSSRSGDVDAGLGVDEDCNDDQSRN